MFDLQYPHDLTEHESQRLRLLFYRCQPVHLDDEDLHDYGPHRQLYDFLVYELGMDCEPARGAVYGLAKKLIEGCEDG